MKALQIIAAAMAVTVAATSAPVNVFAYGETSASSTLFTDTQNISDYTTWKDTVWNKKDDQGNLTGEGESYDSSRIILTPGKTAKDLGFAWYSLEKGEPAGMYRRQPVPEPCCTCQHKKDCDMLQSLPDGLNMLI